jgi:hypothetical protein
MSLVEEVVPLNFPSLTTSEDIFDWWKINKMYLLQLMFNNENI